MFPLTSAEKSVILQWDTFLLLEHTLLNSGVTSISYNLNPLFYNWVLINNSTWGNWFQNPYLKDDGKF